MNERKQHYNSYLNVTSRGQYSPVTATRARYLPEPRRALLLTPGSLDAAATVAVDFLTFATTAFAGFLSTERFGATGRFTPFPEDEATFTERGRLIGGVGCAFMLLILRFRLLVREASMWGSSGTETSRDLVSRRRRT